MKRVFPWLVTLLVVSLGVSTLAQTLAPSTATKDAIVKTYFGELEDYRFKPDQQSFIFETLSGETLFEHNADRPSDPASVMKTATTLTAIAKLGPDFKFATKFYTNGAINAETKTLKGDLIVSGSGDSSFFSEDAFSIAIALNRRGITKIEGDLVVSDDFYVNFDPYPLPSGEKFRTLVDPKQWDLQTRQAWESYIAHATQPDLAPSTVAFSGVEITGKTRLGNEIGLQLLETHESKELSRILKEQNKFSNNIMAEMAGRKLGGLSVIEHYLVDELKLNPANVRIGSASGLTYGYLTPRDTVSIVRKLKGLLEARNMKLEDVLPVQGLDDGTLSDRLIQEAAGTLVGKTGTLTQSGVSALTGIIYTRTQGPILFAIFNHGGNVARFRKTQDDLIASVIDYYGGAAPISYSPATPRERFRTR